LKVSTNHKGGKKLLKTATIYTNDKKNPRLKLSIIGEVEKFVTIRPSQVRLHGLAGEEIKRRVAIVPTPKYPFKIVNVRLRDGKDIAYQLSEEKSENGQKYALTVENKRMQKGSYFDIITLETDSKIKPELQIRVYGQVRQPTQKEKKDE
jgi:uncharacterized membrane protein